MNMKTGAIAAVLVAVFAAFGSPAQGDEAALNDPGRPLSVDEVLAKPEVFAVSAQVLSLLAGDYTGTWSNEWRAPNGHPIWAFNGVIVRRGSTFRAISPDWNGDSRVKEVVAAKGRITCSRPGPSRAHPNTSAGDRSAKWDCMTGTLQTYDGYFELMPLLPLYDLHAPIDYLMASVATFTVASGPGSLVLDWQGPNLGVDVSALKYSYAFAADSVALTVTWNDSIGRMSVGKYSLKRGATGPAVSIRRLSGGRVGVAYAMRDCSVTRREAIANQPQVLVQNNIRCVPNRVSGAGVLALDDRGTLRLISGLSGPVQVRPLGEDGEPNGPVTTVNDGTQGDWWPSDATWVVLEDQAGAWTILD